MMAFVLGEENRAKPRPMNIRLAMISTSGVVGVKRANSARPMMHRPMPAEATILGSILSESLPVKGENTAITMGWAIRISPASWGGYPWINCRYQAKRNAMAAVAL